MKRMVCLGILTLAAVFTMAATYEARQPHATLVVHRVADNLYMLANDPAEQGMRSGGNTAVFVMSSGVTLVDTKIFGYGPDILAEVRKITDKPITSNINTHTQCRHRRPRPQRRAAGVERPRQLRRFLQRPRGHGESGADRRPVGGPGGQLVLGAQSIQRLRGGTGQTAGHGAVHL